MGAFAAILILAALTEAVVEYVSRPLDGVLSGNIPGIAKQYAAMLVGLLVSYNYGVNALVIVAEMLAAQGVWLPIPARDWVGLILTGILVGRGSNLVNDLASLLNGKIIQVKETSAQ